jgi:hypothetical protein
LHGGTLKNFGASSAQKNFDHTLDSERPIKLRKMIQNRIDGINSGTIDNLDASYEGSVNRPMNGLNSFLMHEKGSNKQRNDSYDNLRHRNWGDRQENFTSPRASFDWCP